MRSNNLSVWAVKQSDDGLEYELPMSKHFRKLRSKLLKTLVAFEVGFSLDEKQSAFTIPAGWEFDGASIPRLFWKVIGEPTDKKFRVAAMVHDWLYGVRYNRLVADQIFYKLLVQAGVSKSKASLMYTAVRVGGHAVYHKEPSHCVSRATKLLTGN